MLGGLVLLPALVAAENAPTGGGGIPKPDQTPKLIAVLQSEAAQGDKARACQQLAIMGTKEAVAALAALLPDEQLSNYARCGLEPIADPSADDALREALGTLQGKLLIGVVNSIGVRRDPRAVEGLLKLARNRASGAAPEALLALGRLATPEALEELQKTLTAGHAELRPAAAEGCLLAAEAQAAQGKLDAAVALYDAVRGADVPKALREAATGGAILTRKSAGILLLIETLRSPDKGIFCIGLRAARELHGKDATETLVAELGRLTPDRQALLVVALSDRGDPKALPAILEAIKGGSKLAALAALGVMQRIGNASCVPVLLQAALKDDEELALAAKAALATLPGQEVDADLAARLPQAAGKTRQTLIELAGQRRIEAALPALLPCAEDADAGIRGAAVAALAVLGGEKQVPGLVNILQKTKDQNERAGIERALTAATARGGAASTPRLLPLAQSADSALRVIALHALACAGGTEALAAVRSALKDKDEAVQDEAVRTLSTWPNKWPEDGGVAEPLLALAKSSEKAPHRILALRGYLQYLQAEKKLGNDERLAKVNEVLPLLTRPEEKRLAISVLGAIASPGSLKPLLTFAADPATAQEACSGVLSLAENKDLKGLPKEERQQALQTVVEKAKSAATRKKAQELLKAIP